MVRDTNNASALFKAIPYSTGREAVKSPTQHENEQYVKTPLERKTPTIAIITENELEEAFQKEHCLTDIRDASEIPKRVSDKKVLLVHENKEIDEKTKSHTNCQTDSQEKKITCKRFEHLKAPLFNLQGTATFYSPRDLERYKRQVSLKEAVQFF